MCAKGKLGNKPLHRKLSLTQQTRKGGHTVTSTNHADTDNHPPINHQFYFDLTQQPSTNQGLAVDGRNQKMRENNNPASMHGTIKAAEREIPETEGGGEGNCHAWS